MLKLIKIFNSSILGYWYIPENRDPGLIEMMSALVKLQLLSSQIMIKNLGHPIMQTRLVER